MKKLKKLVAMLVAVAIFVLVPGANVLTVSAAEPVTYYVKYVDDDEGWCFQTGGWNEEEYNRDLYYMFQEIKDGDVVVVDNNGSTEFITLNFDKRLSNLTIMMDSHAVVSATSIDLFAALEGSTSAITGNVKEAHLYTDAGVTFHSNVGTLNIIDTRANICATATVTGTVDHVIVKTITEYIYYEMYNVTAGKFFIEQGTLKTDTAHYSKTPTAAQTSVQAPATQTTPQKNTAGEYDDVPKTGESNIVLWLVGIAVLCLAGKQALKRN